jgi:predicted GIY-YIG superfamily endonuclease
LRSSSDDGIVVVVSWLYLLRCADGSLYVGSTDDLELRLRRHNEGRGSAFTAQRRPVTLAYSESYATRSDARRREAQLKRWTTAKKEALIAGDRAKLHEFARRRRLGR